VRKGKQRKKKAEQEGKGTIILRGKPSQDEGKNHGRITETLLLI